MSVEWDGERPPRDASVRSPAGVRSKSSTAAEESVLAQAQPTRCRTPPQGLVELVRKVADLEVYGHGGGIGGLANACKLYE